MRSAVRRRADRMRVDHARGTTRGPRRWRSMAFVTTTEHTKETGERAQSPPSGPTCPTHAARYGIEGIAWERGPAPPPAPPDPAVGGDGVRADRRRGGHGDDVV